MTSKTSKPLTAELNNLKKCIAKAKLNYQNSLARNGETAETAAHLKHLTYLYGRRDAVALERYERFGR